MARKFTPVLTGPDGAVLANVGRYHRLAVSTVFEMNGGIEWLANWAEQNPSEFFTKLYPKLIPKEVEVTAADTIDDLLLKLDQERDKRMIDVTPKEIFDADKRRTERVGAAPAAIEGEDE